MPPVTQRISDLLGGVSQLAPHRRRPNELESSLNAIHSLSRGFGKRPNTRHVAKLDSTPGNYVTPDVFLLDYGALGRFYAAFTNADLKVWDENGVEQLINFPNGKSYLPVQTVLTKTVTDDFFVVGGVNTPLAGRANGGGTWVRRAFTGTNTDILKCQTYKLLMGILDGSKGWYSPGWAPPTNDYTVQVKAGTNGFSATSIFELGIRVNPATGAGYYATFTQNTPGSFTLNKRTSWTAAPTVLSGPTAFTAIANPTGSLFKTYSIRATGTLIEVIQDGVVIASAVDATYSSGEPQIMGSATAVQQPYMDNFTVIYNTPNPEDTRLMRTATVGARTFVANRTIKVARDATRKAVVQTPQALLYVEHGDYSTQYNVTIDGLQISYETPAGVDASSRRLISTDNIASELTDLLIASFPSYTFAQFGSMIRVARTDNTDFRISTKDGLADTGVRVIKGRVQRSADLPLRCVEDFVLEVVGDPQEATDNYWVKFDVTNADDYRGIWKECARPGEGVALDPATLPHELVFSEEVTTQITAKGFPAFPVVSLVNPTAISEVWSDSQNDAGTVYSGILNGQKYLELWDHNKDYFINLDAANGGPIKLFIPYLVDARAMDETDHLTIEVSYNDAAASVNWTVAARKTITAGQYLQDQMWEIDIPANIGVNFDIRILATYGSGATPTKTGRMRVYPQLVRPTKYWKFAARDLTWGTSTVYPKDTSWIVTCAGLPANYTQLTDMTGAQIANAIEPLVEALAGVDSSVVTNANGTAIRITSTSGTPVTVTVSAVYDDQTHFWNPNVKLGHSDDALVGKTLKNLSDGSLGIINSNYANGLTITGLSGGVENKIRNGDLCVIVDPAKGFAFRQVKWTDRAAGDSITNPWPSFRDEYIRDVFWHRGRLGLLSGGNILFSEVNTPENFYRTVTTDLIDSDPIDVRWAGGNNALFHTAVPWNGETVIFGDTLQVVPKGDPVFGPKTVRLEQLSAYPCDPQAKPEVAGRFVFFARALNGFTQSQVAALYISPRTRVAEAKNLTLDLPTYLTGAPVDFVADSLLNTVFVLTDDRTKLFHLTYQMEDDTPPLVSWGSWQFTGQIMGIDASNGVLTLVMKYGDGVYLETMDLSASSLFLVDRAKDGSTLSPVFSAGSTTWTLPYAVAIDGSEGVVQVVSKADGSVVATTRPSTTTVRAVGDLTLSSLSIGLQYTFEGQPSTIYLRTADYTGIPKADTRKRLQLHRIRFLHEDTKKYDVTVQGAERSVVTYTFSSTTESNASFRVPVMSENEKVTVKIRSTYPTPVWITSAEWEGTFRSPTGLR